jgi:hypothetical protein
MAFVLSSKWHKKVSDVRERGVSFHHEFMGPFFVE